MSTTRSGLRRAFDSIGTISAVASMLLLGVLGAGQARAQVLVVDAMAIENNHADHALEYGKQVMQYAKQLEQYATALESLGVQYQQFTNLLVTLKNIPNSISMPGAALPPLDASRLAQMRCTSPDGAIFGALMSSLTSAFESEYVRAQRQICEMIVDVEVKRYNSTADMLNRIKGPGGYAELAHKLEAMRDGLGLLANGDLSSINNQATRDMANLRAEMANWEMGIAGYDAMLKSMQDMQSTLASQAMNGQPTLLGTSIQAAALAAALHIEE